MPLLGHDIPSHLGATFFLVPEVSPDSHLLLPLFASYIPTLGYPVPTLPDLVDHQVWNISTLVTPTHHKLVLVHLKDTSSSPFRSQFPISETIAVASSPLLLTSYLRDSYIQSTGLVTLPSHLLVLTTYSRTNDTVIPTHPMVTNLYTLLSSNPPTTSHFTVLNLKGGFYCLCTP